MNSFRNIYNSNLSHRAKSVYLRGGCFGRKRRPLKPWQSRNMEAYRFRNHSILCWFSNGRKMVFFTIERPEQMCYNGFENVLEDKEEGVTEA